MATTRGIGSYVPSGSIRQYLATGGRGGGAVPPGGIPLFSGSGFSSGKIKELQEVARRKAVIEKARIEAERKAVIEKARQEAERKAREEIAKAIRIKDQQQRERFLKQIERVKRGKIQAAKLREMTAIQKQQFFRGQAEVAEAIRFQELKKRGQRLTPKAQQVLKKVQKRVGNLEPVKKSKVVKKVVETRFEELIRISKLSPKKQLEEFRKLKIPTKLPIDQTKIGKVIEEAISRAKILVAKGKRFVEDIEKSKAFQKRARGIDIITGGAITERRLGREMESLNKDIEKFNKKYGGKELTESEYNKAISEQKLLESKENKIKEEDKKLEGRISRKIIKEIQKLELKNIAKEGRDIKKFPLTESEKKFIKLTGSMLRTDKEKLKKIEKKPGVLSIAERARLKVSISNSERRLDILKKGGQILLTGTVPITPIGLPSMTKVVFMGAQKTKKGKIITDIIFKTSKNRWGTAKGVTITKGTKGVTVTVGKSTKIGKIFKTKKQAFRGIETIVTKRLSAVERLKLLTVRKGSIKITKNIETLMQGGLGKIQTIKGTKFIRPVIKFPTGKVVMVKAKISTDTFASLSRVITKGDWSKIIGKAITAKGDKAKFLGLIKTTKAGEVGKVFALTAIQKQQYATALKQVTSVMASAMAKAEKVKGLTQVQKLAFASSVISKVADRKKVVPVRVKQRVVVKAKPVIKPRVVVKVKPKVRVKPTMVVKVKPAVKVTPITKQVFSQREKLKLRKKLKLLNKQKVKIKQKLNLKLNLKQKLKLKLKLKLITKQILKLKPPRRPPGRPPGRPPRVPPPIILPLPKLKKKRRKSKKRKKPRSHHVFVRPLKKKGRKKPKLVRITKKPIKKARAESLRNYLIDTSLSRTGKIKSSGKKPSKRRLKVPRSYAKKTKRKFRTYKIVKGKRKKLKKGKVIERKKHLLDTRQEKSKIGLLRRIAQLEKQSKIRKVVGRKPIRKQTKRYSAQRITKRVQFNKGKKQINKSTKKQKRKVTTEQLENLARGRKIRMENLKRRKK